MTKFTSPKATVPNQTEISHNAYDELHDLASIRKVRPSTEAEPDATS